MYTSYYVPPFTNIDKEMDGTIFSNYFKVKNSIDLFCYVKQFRLKKIIVASLIHGVILDVLSVSVYNSQ